MKKLTLKKCREIVGATLEEMAQATGISKATISKWETGKQSPTAEQTIKALEFFSKQGLTVSINFIEFVTTESEV